MLKQIILACRRMPSHLAWLYAKCVSHGVQLYVSLPEGNIQINESLFITDDEETMRQLLEEKAAVLVWLHEGNKDQDLSRVAYAVEHLEEVDFSYLEKVYRRFFGLPWLIGRTGRCLIREMVEEDVDALYKIYSDESITRYMEGLFEDPQKEREYIRRYIENAYTFWGFGTWMAELLSTGECIGRVGFNLRDGYKEPELGFVIARPFQRQGYGYELCSEALEIGRQDYGFTLVNAMVRKENTASLKLCEKLGFEEKRKVSYMGREYLLMQCALS
jgi:RimJ/RimL family protein N-acetyltransferase